MTDQRSSYPYIPTPDAPEPMPSHGQHQHPVDAPAPQTLPDWAEREIRDTTPPPVPRTLGQIEEAATKLAADAVDQSQALVAEMKATRYLMAIIPLMVAATTTCNFTHNALGQLRREDLDHATYKQLIDDMAESVGLLHGRLQMLRSNA